MLKSMWFDTIEPKKFKNLKESIDTKILVIGGGITGISCAYELSEYFDDITLVTMNDLYSGTTGNTTAKITYQHGYIYHDLIKSVGLDKAKKYYEFNKMGLKRLTDIIKQKNIECDYQEVDSYLYSYQSEEENLKKELKAYDDIGIKGTLSAIEAFDKIALKVKNQAHFHPLKYLEAIVSILEKKNVRIYENTQIRSISENTAHTKLHTITAQHIIVATGYPIYPNHNLFFTKLVPSVSYVVAGIPQKPIPNANYINTKSPIVSIRYLNDIMIVGGMSHDSKEIKEANEEYHKLTEIGRDYFEINDFLYSWSTRDFRSIDLLPFVGKITDNIYIATGYGKWGMTNSVAASILIRELILNKDNKYQKIFNPNRSLCFKPKYLKYNLGSINTFIKTKKIYERLHELDLTEGKIIKFHNTRYGIYRDDNNIIHIVKATCTHLGCGLKFNKVDRTYDCPCHGSKFNFDGRVILGPAQKNLKSMRIQNKQTKHQTIKKEIPNETSDK